MRVDAAEFVPVAATEWAQGSFVPMSGADKLSADSPAFVPGAASQQAGMSWQQPPWEAWETGFDYSDYTAPAMEYGVTEPEYMDALPQHAEPELEFANAGLIPNTESPVPMVTYVDEDTFLTPQPMEETDALQSAPISPKSGRDALDDINFSEQADKVHQSGPSSNSQASCHSRGSSQAGTIDLERSRQCELTGTGCAASSTCPSATAGCCGVLSVHGRKLHWTLTGSDCQSCRDFALDEWPQGEGVESPKFVVAGVALRLTFFPAGAPVTGDGDCAVGVLCEDKAKLKFELFLNGRRSGTKVMLGQKFSCDFRRPEFASEADMITVALEVYSNLFYFGFS